MVDDDYRVADLHREFTERCDGFSVVGVALSGREALALASELSPDLVLLDLYLPDLHGLEVARLLRSLGTCDIIIITAARDVSNIRTAIGEGALHYLVKPFNFADLRHRLEHYRRWREQLDGLKEANQPMIDELMGALRVEPARVLPKGLGKETLRLVESALRESKEPLSADDVGHVTGISRVAARRYLRYLVDAGGVEMTQEYGTPGRPRQLFSAGGGSG